MHFSRSVNLSKILQRYEVSRYQRYSLILRSSLRKGSLSISLLIFLRIQVDSQIFMQLLSNSEPSHSRQSENSSRAYMMKIIPMMSSVWQDYSFLQMIAPRSKPRCSMRVKEYKIILLYLYIRLYSIYFIFYTKICFIKLLLLSLFLE
jgi:hypothetical protein